ncbi:MAG: NUDIX hydrolase [Candidatus Roizmanbacteria bacterium]|nr:NUDIX hydrolase [Candidatus Roizmanbacteria bacterium]
MLTCLFEDGGKGFLRHCTVGSILLNQDKDAILLVRRAKELSEGGKLAFPGGYMERNETLVQTALREAQEETGFNVEIHNLFRINDNPNRPREDRQNVDFIFIGQILNKESNPDDEVSELVWHKLNSELNSDEIAFDHAETISLYKDYIKEPFVLPVIAGGVFTKDS